MDKRIGKQVSELEDLVALIRLLRAPDGCPWDQKQDMGSIRAYVIEEAHELAAAIDTEDSRAVCEELGDLLFQAAFVACLGEEAGDFRAEDAVQGIYDKMVARHPHVFPVDERAAAEDKPSNVDEVLAAWEAQKSRERAREKGSESILSGVPASLPALTGAYRLTQKAAGVGFDWPDVHGVLDKVREELDELEQVLAARATSAAGISSDSSRGGSASDDSTLDDSTLNDSALNEELGDLLFAVANLGRHLKKDPEAALAAGNLKFRRRFEAVEEILRERGESLVDADLERMEEAWQEVKRREKAGS